MKNYNIENLKTLNKNAVLIDDKTAEIKVATGGIMDGYLSHFKEIMAITGITNFKSATIFSADLIAYWDLESKKFLRCSRNPVSSEKGQGILYNKNAVDRTVEPSSRRKVTNKINSALELSIDWQKIDSYKSLLETIKHEEEKSTLETVKFFIEDYKEFGKTFHNSTESKQKDILADLRQIMKNARTTTVGKATRIKSKKSATKKVA